MSETSDESEYKPDSDQDEDSDDDSGCSEAAKEPDPSDAEIAAQSKPDTERESSSSESVAAESEIDNKNREKKRCPMKKCGAKVIHLPRHLRMVHKWSAGSARMAVNSLGLRKKRTAKRERPVRKCPIDGCRFRGPRLDNHLVFQHGHNRKSKEYLSLLKNATKIVPGHKRKNTLPSKQHTKKRKLAGKSTPEVDKTPPPSRAANQQKKKTKQGETGTLEANMSSPTSGASKHIPEKKLRLAGGSTPEANDMPDSPPSEVGTLNLFSDTENEDNEDGCESDSNETGDNLQAENEDGYESDSIEIADNVQANESTPEGIIKQFFEWLQSADGGLKAERNAKQYSDQVRLVIKNLCPSSEDDDKILLDKILDKVTLREWLKDFEKKSKPGTIKSYIISLRMFITFLICEHKVEGDQINQARKVKEILTQWSSALQKAVKKRFWAKRVEDMQRRITPDQIRQFEKSEPARRAVTVLGQCEEDELSQQDYCVTRDFLMTELLINNGQRSGAIRNMTLEEFESASEEGDHHVVMVKIIKLPLLMVQLH